MGHVIVLGDPGGLWSVTDEANPATFVSKLDKAKVAIGNAASLLLKNRPLYYIFHNFAGTATSTSTSFLGPYSRFPAALDHPARTAPCAELSPHAI